VAYIGFNVPASLMPPGQEPPEIWTVDPHNSASIGGHAVVLVGYDAQYAKVISWGQYYQMTWQFFAKFVDEVYAIAYDAWFNAQNTDPLGLTLPQLEQQMTALKEKA
jgi:C1A family cysteine protease